MAKRAKQEADKDFVHCFPDCRIHKGKFNDKCQCRNPACDYCGGKCKSFHHTTDANLSEGKFIPVCDQCLMSSKYFCHLTERPPTLESLQGKKIEDGKINVVLKNFGVFFRLINSKK